MKKIVLLIMCLLLSQAVFSRASGLLFNVSISGMTLSLKPKTNHIYTDVGLLITSPNYRFSKPATECVGWPNTNGYCKFSAGPSAPALVSIEGSDGVLQFKLCLSYWGKLSCQMYTMEIINQEQCTAAGGHIVSGSNACWIRVPAVPSTVLRCSSACNTGGLALQDPGPTNSSALAGNVCSAFGFIALPGSAPQSATLIGTRNDFPIDCYWTAVNGTNWDNPNNVEYTGDGSYFCPCV